MAPDNDTKTNRRWGRSIILEEIGFQYFSHTQGCLIKSCVSLRFIKFLEFTQGPLQGRSPPPPLSAPLHCLPPSLATDLKQKLAPRSAMRGTYFDRPLSNVRDHIFIGGMSLLSAPAQPHRPHSRNDSDFPAGPNLLPPVLHFLSCPAPKQDMGREQRAEDRDNTHGGAPQVIGLSLRGLW